MASKPHQLHIYFFPMMGHGHMIPMVDMAKLFSGHGVKTTIITTPLNAPLISKTIDMDTKLGSNISIRVIKFSSLEVGLPEGCENLSSVTSPEMIVKFYKATYMLQEPFEQLLREDSPDCLVADMYFPWATELASKLGIPRLVFHGTGVFPLCVHHSLVHHKPFETIESDSEPVIVPGLPDTIKMTRRELSDHNREGGTQNYIATLFQEIMKAELTSYGVLVNSFHELEPAYSEYYREVVGRKAWHIGPVSLCNGDNDLKGKRGNKSSIDEQECLNWLDSKKAKSVLYVCFGSLADFSAAQLLEIAVGLEASEQQFIWVVRKEKEKDEEWLPEGFEKRIEGKGLIIRGWAPQVLILENEAIGGFVTHCGWNSLLEGVTAGVPMVTWPLFVDQFANEKFVTDVLRVGVRVGSLGWSRWADDNKAFVKKENIEKAVTQLMVGEEAEIMRNRAKALQEKARRAFEDGGSSYSDLNSLLKELRSIRS